MNKKRISTNFFVWGYAICAALTFARPRPGVTHWGCDWLQCGRPLMARIGSIADILGLIVFLVFIYKIWAAIQDGKTRSSAGEAFGLLLIPLFNVFWLYRAVWGFAKEFNRFLERNKISASRLPEGLFLACSILMSLRWLYRWIATLKPITGVGFTLGAYSYYQAIPVHSLAILVIYKSCQAVNALPAPAQREE